MVIRRPKVLPGDPLGVPPAPRNPPKFSPGSRGDSRGGLSVGACGGVVAVIIVVVQLCDADALLFSSGLDIVFNLNFPFIQVMFRLVPLKGQSFLLPQDGDYIYHP